MDDHQGATGLTEDEIGTLRALMERMFPSDDLGPGAREIGVVEYMLRSFAGAYAGHIPTYRRVLAALNRVADGKWKSTFVALSPAQQDTLIARLERGELQEFASTEHARVFDLIWQHMREGLFADPIHGGNRDMLGWRLIGFPGAQLGYSAAEQALDAVITREPRSVADLREPG
jgi:gluconate 2-dehydrogenase alpha chain